MTYGVEVVVPIEMSIFTFRISNYDASTNDQNLSNDIELCEDLRDEVEQRNQSYKTDVARYHDHHIRTKSFAIGSLVLQKASIS